MNDSFGDSHQIAARPASNPIGGAAIWQVSPKLLQPGLYTAFNENEGAAPYDRGSLMYDAVLRWSLYHRLAWGSSMRGYAEFARDAFESAGGGGFAEIGCGSLLFTAAMYRQKSSASALLIDRSLQMLRRGIRRLGAARPEGVVALHASGDDVPVLPKVFSSILCLNLLHVACDRKAIVSEFRRTLAPQNGRLFVSALVKAGRWSDASIRFLQSTGEFGAPLTPEKLAETVAGNWGRVESMRVDGNMAYVVVRHAG